MLQRVNGRQMNVKPGGLEALYQDASKLIDDLHRAMSRGRGSPELFAQVDKALAALPLPSAQFSAIKCRFFNALRYHLVGELGAASFELHLLQRSVRLGRTAEEPADDLNRLYGLPPSVLCAGASDNSQFKSRASFQREV